MVSVGLLKAATLHNENPVSEMPGHRTAWPNVQYHDGQLLLRAVRDEPVTRVHLSGVEVAGESS